MQLLTKMQLVTGYILVSNCWKSEIFFHYVISVKYKPNVMSARTGNEHNAEIAPDAHYQ